MYCVSISAILVLKLKTKAKLFWFVNHSRVKTSKPVKRSNGNPRFVKFAENDGWRVAKSFKKYLTSKIGWATPEFTLVDK
ncbi:hypothetical protein DP117_35030 [Brasilonema sp. UFV-L1]|nr:hypothetical protein [Brasilonema sp. UFV-L1]